MPSTMDAISTKSEIYQPSAEVIAQANVPDYLDLRQQAIADPIAFWDARAKELLDWYEPYTQVLDSSTAPFFKWFVGGKTNIVHNALDRHVKSWRKNKLAMHLGRRRRRAAHLLLLQAVEGGQPLRQRPQEHGRQEGRHGHDLHGARARAADRHAGHGQDRRDPQRRLRRLLRAGAGRPHHRRQEQGRGHLRRRLAARQDGQPQGDHRRGRQPQPDRAEGDRATSAPGQEVNMQPAAISGGTS